MRGQGSTSADRTGGAIAISDESTEVRFIDPTDFDRIRHHAERRQCPIPWTAAY